MGCITSNDHDSYDDNEDDNNNNKNIDKIIVISLNVPKHFLKLIF